LSVASFPDPQQPAQAQLLQALGRAWSAGAPVDWNAFSAFEGGERRRKVPLPTYPFERRRHLIDPPGVQLRPEPVPTEVRTGSEPLVDYLARVWREALGVDRVGPDDDFFDLGGDSVIGLQIAARLRDAGYEVSSAQLYETPTVASLAAVLSLTPGITPEPEPQRFTPAGVDERTLSRVSALLEEIDREP
jgi:acyl transferase domain-containing protein